MTTTTENQTIHVCGHGAKGHRDEQAPLICDACGRPRSVFHHAKRRCPLTGGPAVKLICASPHKRRDRQRLQQKGWTKQEQKPIPIRARRPLYFHPDGTDNGGKAIVEETFQGIQCCRGKLAHFMPRSLTVRSFESGMGHIRCGESNCPEGTKMRATMRSKGLTQVSEDTYQELSNLLEHVSMESWPAHKSAYSDIIERETDSNQKPGRPSDIQQGVNGQHPSCKGRDHAEYVHCYNLSAEHIPARPACQTQPNGHGPLKFVAYSEHAEQEAAAAHGLPLCPNCRKACDRRRELINSILR